MIRRWLRRVLGLDELAVRVQALEARESASAALVLTLRWCRRCYVLYSTLADSKADPSYCSFCRGIRQGAERSAN